VAAGLNRGKQGNFRKPGRRRRSACQRYALYFETPGAGGHAAKGVRTGRSAETTSVGFLAERSSLSLITGFATRISGKRVSGTTTTMLHRPLFAPLIIGFWCLTSGWLFMAKILPSLQPGSPPGHQALYASGSRIVPIGWTVLWNGVPVGWALTEAARTDAGGLLVDSRLHFQRLPVEDVLPAWVGALIQRIVVQQPALTFDATGRLSIDQAGRLRQFTSAVTIPGSPETVRLEGTVDEGSVQIELRAGDLRYDTQRHLPSHIMIADELSPQASLPGLYEGRRWTVPTYSPLRPGHTPLEILHAEVGGEETLFWENDLKRVHVVSYHEDPSSPREPRCRLWVDLGGRVLRQESALLGAKLAFVRRTEEAAARLADDVRQGWIPGGLPEADARRPTVP
jgi:hypothetical protein